MTIVIKKGNHSTFRMPELLFMSKEKSLDYYVIFDQSCAYDIGEDQDDVNKLFGIGYFPFHRWNSVRFGWRYSKDVDKIEILSYVYVNKVRYFEHICYVDFFNSYKFSISHISDLKVIFAVSEMNDGKVYRSEFLSKFRSFGYLLGPYFGGNKTAPHDIQLYMARIH
jgi:hypothetical protein